MAFLFIELRHPSLVPVLLRVRAHGTPGALNGAALPRILIAPGPLKVSRQSHVAIGRLDDSVLMGHAVVISTGALSVVAAEDLVAMHILRP